MNIDINNLGTFTDIAAVWAAYPEGGQEGDYLFIGTTKYRWNKYNLNWENASVVTESEARKLTELYADVTVGNDLHVGGTLYYHRLKGYDLGLFSTSTALSTAYPSPEVGMWAFVVHPSIEDKYQLYVCETAGTWTLTVEETTLDILDFEQYETTLALMQQIANGAQLAGYRAALSVSDLPTTDPDPTLGWIVEGKLYVYVGTGGDTLGGLYQDCGYLRGAKGDKGDKGDNGVVLDGVTVFSSASSLEDKTTAEKEEMVPDGNMVEAIGNNLHDAIWEVTTATEEQSMTSLFTFTDGKGVQDDGSRYTSSYFAYSDIIALPRNAVQVKIRLPRRIEGTTIGMAFYSSDTSYGTTYCVGGKSSTYTSYPSTLTTGQYTVDVPEGATHLATSWFSTSAISTGTGELTPFSCVAVVLKEREKYAKNAAIDECEEGIASLENKTSLEKISITHNRILEHTYYAYDADPEPDTPGIHTETTTTSNGMFEFAVSDDTAFYHATVRPSYRICAVFLDADREILDFIDYGSTVTALRPIEFTVPEDTKYVQLLGNTSSGTPTLTAESKLLRMIEGGDSNVKILGVGDSWMRDSLCELWPVLNAAGINATIGHGYQGASGLTNQYLGIDDETRYYKHSNFYQYVHGTHQYWEYKTVTPDFLPSAANYQNGKCGVAETVGDIEIWGKDGNGGWAAKTLEYCVQKHDWDYILLEIGTTELMSLEDIEDPETYPNAVDVASIITKIKGLMTEEGAAKVKFGLLLRWSYPKEIVSTYTPSSTFLRMMGTDATAYGQMTTEQRIALFRSATTVMQEKCDALAAHLGDDCYFIINACQSIQDARDNAVLNSVGVGLNRSLTDTHLTVGIPKYIVGCAIARDLLGLSGHAVSSYLPDGTDATGNTDGGAESNPVTPTRALCSISRRVVFGH